MIDKKWAYWNPDNVCDESTETNELNVAWMKNIDVDKVKQRNNKENLRTLAHHFFECWLEGFMQTEAGAVTNLSLVWTVDTSTLSAYLYEHN